MSSLIGGALNVFVNCLPASHCCNPCLTKHAWYVESTICMMGVIMVALNDFPQLPVSNAAAQA